jgi:thioredoxin 1
MTRLKNKLRITKLSALLIALAWLTGCQKTVDERLAELGAAPGQVATLREATFDQAIAEGVTLVEFWADWCVPCQQQGEILKELAQAVSNRAVIARFDIGTSKKRVKQFNLEYLPTLMLFKDGKPLQTYTGLTERATLVVAVGSSSGQ